MTNNKNIHNSKTVIFILLNLFLVILINLAKEFSNIFTKLIPKGFLNLYFFALFARAVALIKNIYTKFISVEYSITGEDNYLVLAFASEVSPFTNKNVLFFNGENASPKSQEIVLAKANEKYLDNNLKNKKLLNYNFTKGWSNKVSSVSKLSGVTKNNWYLPINLNKLISAFFKSIYCLISKPKFIHTPDKIIIEILYYITIPDHNIFKWYNFIYNPKNYNLDAKNNNNSIGIISRNSQILRKIKKVRRSKLLKTLLFKNYLLKQRLFNLNNSNIANVYKNKFILFFKLLNSFFGNAKAIELNLIRIHKSDYEVNILAQFLVLILKKKNIRIAINKLYNKNNIGLLSNGVAPANENILTNIANISGLYIHIGGRLMREPIIPRLTTKKFERGAIATGKVNFLDNARITKKNKKGAFTIKIAFAQNI